MNEFKLEVQWLNPNSLIPYAKNHKEHPADQVDRIANQISSFGFDQPIVVDKHNVIIKGHGRREASIKLGLTSVPVIVQTLDEYQAMAARIADNKLNESEWKKEYLTFDLNTLKLHNVNLQLTGFTGQELKPFIDRPDLPDFMKKIEDFNYKPETKEKENVLSFTVVFQKQEELDEFSQLMADLKVKFPNIESAGSRLLEQFRESYK